MARRNDNDASQHAYRPEKQPFGDVAYNLRILGLPSENHKKTRFRICVFVQAVFVLTITAKNNMNTSICTQYLFWTD